MNDLARRLGLLLTLTPFTAALAQTPAPTAGVGIGVTTPLSRLHVAEGSVLFSAAGDVAPNGSSGPTPITGTGRRLLWHADKAAFRVGYLGQGNNFNGATFWDDANIGAYSFAAGFNVQASGRSAVALGEEAQALNDYSLALHGYASGFGSVVVGYGSQATQDFAVAIGSSALSGGVGSISIGPNNAYGNYATAIGLQNRAGAQFSLAVGKNARAEHQGAAVFSDGSALSTLNYVISSAPNQLSMRYSGGYRLYSTARANSPEGTLTSPVAGVELAPGAGSWTTLSDRRAKENFRPVDAEQVLQKVAALPVTEWNYKSQPATQRHVGPMAQDFYQAFRLDGLDRDTTINTGDIDGVNMVAIQALAQRTARLQQENEQLRAQLRQKDEQLATQLQLLNQRLAALEQPTMPRQPRRKSSNVTQNVATN
ncbi:tail fiber domain-containing protein [Hymenobacter sp. CRA2]|uniref:tail fiber domain-containing protein n=1 Tax=Hymenobacter sp. CRA2 TaxID=1955620 RepID=UPI00098FF198|nr:tail fiber domain-containing protein [Hymenobacter sp. CRA2]OON67689.1 hypothetical protein B0919_15920 [Hymenobacter sp. CRA2]